MPDRQPVHDSRPLGRRMLAWALSGLAMFLAGSVAWIGWRAMTNPDVRLKPQWLAEGQELDGSFWSPLLLTVVLGSLAVGWVLWRAYTRIRAGEDLYADRFGAGVRRRGERHVRSGEEA